VSRTSPRPAPGLRFEQLEDRLTPAGSYLPAGEFNWTQFSPSGDLAQLVWEGQTLVYRTRAANTWAEEPVVVAPTFSRAQYDTRDAVEKATQSAQLVFTADGTAHVLYLNSVWNGTAGAYQTVIEHYARTASGWQHVESIQPPWLSNWGPNNLVAEAGPNNSLHLLFTETYTAATGVGNQGTGILWYATNKSGSWTYDKVADTTDLKQDVWFTGGRWAPRFLSLAVDSQNNAYVTYTPQFYIAGAFSTVNSVLKYATNAGGSWQSQTVYSPPDGTGDAGLGASVAVGPNGQVAIASYFVDRYTTGSPQTSQLQYHTPDGKGGWTTTVVASSPDGYVAGDGPHFTGFSPELYFDARGRPNIVFSDEAGQHNPVSYANEVSGQIRLATLTAGKWALQTVYRQTNPLVNQMFFPVAATNGKTTVFAGLKAVSTLDANQNPTRTDFTLVDVNAPAGSPTLPPPAPPPVNPPPPPPPVTTTRAGVATPAASDGSPAPVTASDPAALAAATDAGVTTQVTVYRSDGNEDFGITPFGPDYTGGARVIRADVTGDGTPDVIVATAGGVQARVRIWDGATRQLIFDDTPFGDFTGGLVVAAGDINGDGVADLAIGPDVGGGPRIQLWSGGDFKPLMPDFYGLPYPDFRGGLRLAIGDFNRDGFADLVVAPGEGGGPRLTVYDGKSMLGGKPQLLVNDFYAFDGSLRTGLELSAGDVDGDGYADIVVGTGVGGGPRVRVISGADLAAGNVRVEADFFAGDPADRGGARVGVVNWDHDKQADIVTGSGAGPRVAVYTGAGLDTTTPKPAVEFDAFASGGVYVG
jgi:hypothetical protein